MIIFEHRWFDMNNEVLMEKNPSEEARRPIVARAYTVRAFCEAFGVGRTSCYNLIKAKKLPSVKIAGRRVIPADAAELLIAEKPVDKPKPPPRGASRGAP